ncbi:hypothetical protein ASF72_09880 [Arthrobacter sp. Leaf141]|uniref:hypothetical protein n=1 Tax=Arthrobacter sp. Leaf141 TaxID=1736273 RepID=UPI0006F3F606|nr:hypothetical protein [Arthrobacter sp. Leaf141]KQR03444.1 hypothetical protein ASF72_09880 [Arthrobacter sp. Leaf141]
MKRAPAARTMLATAVAAAVLAGCSAPSAPAPAWTAQPEDTAVTQGTASPDGTASPEGTEAASASPSATDTARPVATAAVWKTFADAGRKVSFDLPQDWIAQSVSPAAGTLPGALKIEVKKPDGTFMAALQTGLPASAVDCPEGSRKPYTVISSVPVDLPALSGEATIPPRVVFRVIQGYRYFGSYGITNVVGGAGNLACELRNTVRGPAAIGDYSFGDVPALKAYATDELVAPAKAFDTLAQAAAYANEGTEFANVQRMLMSLKVSP